MEQAVAEEKVLNIHTLIAMVLADVDIFLLKELDQVTDKDRIFTTNEIRDQLKRSGMRILSALKSLDVDVLEPIECDYYDLVRQQFKNLK